MQRQGRHPPRAAHALSISLALILWPIVSHAQATLDPDHFTSGIARLLNESGIPVPVRIVSRLTLEAPAPNGGSVQISLDRIFAACRADEARCPAFVENFLSGTKNVLQPASIQQSPAALRAAIRPERYIRENPAVAALAIRVTAPNLPEGLVALLYLDAPQTMRVVSANDLDKLHLSHEQAGTESLRNVAATLRPTEQIIKYLPPGQVGLVQDGPYASSRLLLHADWAKASALFGGHLIVAAPSAEELIYGDGSSAAAVSAFSALAQQRFAKAERPISPAVFEWHSERWMIVAK